MAVVFATNINVFTAPEVSALGHDVVSWAWRDGSRTVPEQRADLEAQTRRALRRFPDADDVTSAYLAHKAMLPERGALSAARAVLWTVKSVRRADRVLVAAPPPGVDRIMWLAALVTARLLRRPLFVYSEVWIEPVGRSYRASRLVQRVLRSTAARILVPSQVHRAHHAARGVPPERISVIDSIYCPRPPTERLLPVPAAASDGPFTFLYVGRLVACKGLERVLPIVARMARTDPRVRLLVVAGHHDQRLGTDSGYGDRCRRLIAEMEPGVVRLTEHVDDIETVYAQADVLVMPNRILPDDKVPAESWGRVAEEAMMHGVPVIATDAVPAALELVVPGVNGLVVPWQSDRGLEAALVAAASGADAVSDSPP